MEKYKAFVASVGIADYSRKMLFAILLSSLFFDALGWLMWDKTNLFAAILFITLVVIGIIQVMIIIRRDKKRRFMVITILLTQFTLISIENLWDSLLRETAEFTTNTKVIVAANFIMWIIQAVIIAIWTKKRVESGNYINTNSNSTRSKRYAIVALAVALLFLVQQLRKTLGIIFYFTTIGLMAVGPMMGIVTTLCMRHYYVMKYDLEDSIVIYNNREQF